MTVGVDCVFEAALGLDELQGWDRFLAIDPLCFDEQGVLHAKTTRGTDEPAP